MNGDLYCAGRPKSGADKQRVMGRRSAMVLAVLAATLMAMPATAKQKTQTYLRFGAGSESCAKVFSGSDDSESFVWVMGYVSGLNHALFNHVGRSTDGDGVFGEVTLVCKAEPSMKLVEAVDRVYDRMGRQSR